MTARNLWHLSIAGRLQGPLDEAALRDLAQAGNLTPHTLIRAEGETEWRMLSTVPELAALFSSPATSEPSSPKPTIPPRHPMRSNYAAVAAVVLLVVGYWSWHLGWIGLDLWPWYKPTVGNRQVLSERWMKLPSAYGLYVLDEGEIRPFPDPQGTAKLGADAEFLHYERPNNLIRGIAFVELAGLRSAGPDEIGIGCYLMPLRRHPDMMRMIPEQPFPPGFYQLGALGTFFVDYETFEQQLRDRTEAALRDHKWMKAIEYGSLWTYIPGGMTFETLPLRRRWSRYLIENVEPDDSVSVEDVVNILGMAVSWAPEFERQAVSRALELAEESLARRGGTSAAIRLFEYARSKDQDAAIEIGKIAWRELSHRLVDPVKLGQKDFELLFTLCAQVGFPEEAQEHPSYRLAQALSLFIQGGQMRALPILQSLAASTTDPNVARVAQLILDPPPAGMMEVERSPIVFKDSSGRDAMRIELKAVQVGTREIELDFSLRNLSEREQFLMFAENVSEGSGSYKLLSLTDNTGVTRECVPGFGGATLVALGNRGNLRGVRLEPGSNSNIFAVFPIVAPGATMVSFVSPRYQNQGAWGFEAIPVKAGPFDQPLRVLPLTNTGLSPSEVRPTQESKPTAQPSLLPALTESREPTPPTKLSSLADAVSTSPTFAEVPSTAVPGVSSRPGDILPTATHKIETIRTDIPSTAGPEVMPQPIETPRAKPNASDSQRTAATAARQEARQEREQSRQRIGTSPIKKKMFESAEHLQGVAEDAYQAGDYGRAVHYYREAIKLYKNFGN